MQAASSRASPSSSSSSRSPSRRLVTPSVTQSSRSPGPRVTCWAVKPWPSITPSTGCEAAAVPGRPWPRNASGSGCPAQASSIWRGEPGTVSPGSVLPGPDFRGLDFPVHEGEERPRRMLVQDQLVQPVQRGGDAEAGGAEDTQRIAGQGGHRQAGGTRPAHFADGKSPASPGHREHVAEVAAGVRAGRPDPGRPAGAGRARRPARRPGPGAARAAPGWPAAPASACRCCAASREFSRASAIRPARSSASPCTSRDGRPPCGPPRMSSPSGPSWLVSGKHQAPRAARSATPAGASAGTSAASGQERGAPARGPGPPPGTTPGITRRRTVTAQVQQPGQRARQRFVRVPRHGEPQVTAGTGEQDRAPGRQPGHGDPPGHGQDPVLVQRAGQQRAGFGEHPDPGAPGALQLGQPGAFQRRPHLVGQLLQPLDVAARRTGPAGRPRRPAPRSPGRPP